MKSKSIIFHGLGRYVGKSTLICALSRVLYEDKIQVAPFKAQSKTLNTYITQNGYEIDRIQAMQAEAGGITPIVDMNPILLKPISENLLQVIIHGKIAGNFHYEEYKKIKKELVVQPIIESYRRLSEKFSTIIVEGTGNFTPLLLKNINKDIELDVDSSIESPIILIGDSIRGETLPSLTGIFDFIDKKTKNRIAGFIINKYKGDKNEINSIIKLLEQKTKKPVFGVIPYIHGMNLDGENFIINNTKLSLSVFNSGHKVCINTFYLPHISNNSDFDSIEADGGIHFQYVIRKRHFGKPDVLIIPHTNNLIYDLKHLLERGYKEKLWELHNTGVMIIGIGDGFHMLGEEITYYSGKGSEQKKIQGLGLLPFTSVLNKNKFIEEVTVKSLNIPFYNDKIQGFKVDSAIIELYNKKQPLFSLVNKRNKTINDGIANENFSVWGTNVYGLFNNSTFLKNFINYIKNRKAIPRNEHIFINKTEREKSYNKMAEVVRKNIDMGKIYKLFR